MNPVAVTDLYPGFVPEYDMLDEKGGLLVAAGTELSARHLDVMIRRNITEVFFRDTRSDSEIRRLLDQELKNIGGLDLDEDGVSRTVMPRIQLEHLDKVAAGRSGLAALLEGPAATRLDTAIEKLVLHGASQPRPAVVPLGTADRSEVYKAQKKREYSNALSALAGMLSQLARTTHLNPEPLKAIVAQLLDTMRKDRALTICLAGTAPSGNEYLFHHSLNVSILSMNIALTQGFDVRHVAEIGLAGLLHDVGMLMVPAEIRLKKGTLDRDEWFEIQKHPVLGLHALERIDGIPELCAIAVYQSHERENGQGYPRQRDGRFVHPAAKILACADMYEAVSSPRAHRKALIPYRAMEVLVKLAGAGVCSRETVQMFLNTISLFPIGSFVELSDHRVARVVGTNGKSYTKPRVMAITGKNRNRIDESHYEMIDLKLTPELQIVRSLHQSMIDISDTLSGF